MAGNVKAVPEGTHTITAHLSVRDAQKAIEFYQKAFGAQVAPHAQDSRRQSHARHAEDWRFAVDARRRIPRHGHAVTPNSWR